MFDDEVEFYSNPIELKYNEIDNYRLQEPIELQLQIPSQYLSNLEADTLFLPIMLKINRDFRFDQKKGLIIIPKH